MPNKFLRAIKLGPRQLSLFDHDNTVALRQEILVRVTSQVERHGRIDVMAFSKETAADLNESQFEIIQHLFWLAQDLKITFQSDGAALSLEAARDRLTENTRPNVAVTLATRVEESVFESARLFFNQVCDSALAYRGRDQDGFAHGLKRQFGRWKKTLEGRRAPALRPGFPGIGDIQSGLKDIAVLTTKKDTASLIQSFYDHRDHIGALAKTIRALTVFYDRDKDKWSLVIDFAGSARKTLTTMNDPGAVAGDYERLLAIIASSHPYDRVDEAFALFKTLKPHHKKQLALQTARHREEALAIVLSLTTTMRQHLCAIGAADDLRNQSLYPLRQADRQIRAAKTIKEIESLLQTARESFEDFRHAR